MKLRPRTPAVAQPSRMQLRPRKTTTTSPKATKIQKAKIQKAPRTSRPVKKKKPTTIKRPGADVVETSRSGWQSLPAEIKLMIAEEMMWLFDGTTKLCGMASLCREIQEVVEKQTFSSLRLSSKADILRLHQMSRGPSKLSKGIRKIHLSTRLRSYGHDSCCVKENQTTINKNNQIFDSQIFSLFQTLSAWDSAGLTLELSAFSSSDEKHTCRRDAGPSRHLWPSYGRMCPLYAISPGPMQRTLGSLLDAEDELPEVSAVTRFVVSQENFRSLGPTTLANFISKFPCLQDITYEPWRSIDEESQNDRDAAIEALLDGLQSHSFIKNVSILEAHQLYNKTFPEPKRPALALAAAKLSQRLKSFSASFVFDALDFFLCCDQIPFSSWPNLESIALTAEAVGNSRAPEAIDYLVLQAGRVALRMPKLRLMELWFSDDDYGSHWFLFRYEIASKRPKVTIQMASREVNLSQTARELWSRVAASVPGSGPEVEYTTPVPLGVDFREMPNGVIERLQSNVRHDVSKK